MAKSKTIYVCIDCGYQSPKSLGRCFECKAWGTMEEQAPVTVAPRTLSSSVFAVSP